MISEHTATHTPRHGLAIHGPKVRPSAAFDNAVECAGIRSKDSRTRLWTSSVTIALWHALTEWCKPSFFELERRAPEHRRLGPGLSRESDSFWPLSEW